MRDHDGTLSFAPRLPEALTRLAFTISLRGRRLAVDVRPATATYTLLDGEPLHIPHHGQPITVSPGDPACARSSQRRPRSPTPASHPDASRPSGSPWKPPTTRPAESARRRRGTTRKGRVPAESPPRMRAAAPRASSSRAVRVSSLAA